MQEGAYFQDILRYGLEQGQFPEAIGREQEWLDWRLAHHNQPYSCLSTKPPNNAGFKLRIAALRAWAG